jgi:hypothetical protein
MLLLQVDRLDEYCVAFTKKEETCSKLVKSKENCCFKTVLFIKHAWEKNNCCMYSCLVIVFYWLQRSGCCHYHHCRGSLPHFAWVTPYTLISPPHIFQTTKTKTLESPKWFTIGAIEKQKVQSYDLRIVGWYNGWHLKNTQMTRQTQQEYAHTTHNPYYGCCAVKSSHQNFLLIACLVLTFYICLILSDKPSYFVVILDMAIWWWCRVTLLFITVLLFLFNPPLFCFLLHLIFKLSSCSHISNTALFSFCQLLASCHALIYARHLNENHELKDKGGRQFLAPLKWHNNSNSFHAYFYTNATSAIQALVWLK